MSNNKSIGIIANPASGKDIRRLVAQGSVYDNNEKVNIIRRILLGIKATGITNVLYMPDYYHSIEKALDGIKLSFKPNKLDMKLLGKQSDSITAGRLMAEKEVSCIITLGGDGTNRAVVKGSSVVPILPISTGTNNVFPYMVEGTLAGMAAGVVAHGILPIEDITQRSNRLDVFIDGKFADLALVDIAIYDDPFVGSRAVWDMSKVREIIFSLAKAAIMGLASIGGALNCKNMDDQHGMHIVLSESDVNEGVEVIAPIAPGLINKLKIKELSLLEEGDEVLVNHIPSVLALDGEREIEVGSKKQVSIKFSKMGPLVLKVNKVLKAAAQANFFMQNTSSLRQNECILKQLGLCKTPCDK